MKPPIVKTIGLLAPLLALIINTWDKVVDVNYPITLKTFIGLAVVFGGLVIANEWYNYVKLRPKSYIPNSPAINDYMCEWLEKGGRCLILSRNLSWVGKKELALLERKAKAKDLELIVGAENEIVSNLKAAGAIVFNYSGLNFKPFSRFTIINYGKNGEQIAIGRPSKGKHVITEHSKNDDDIFVLAKDLQSALKSALKVTCTDG